MALRSEEKTELKCRPCGKILPAGDYTYSQKKKKYRRRCMPCVAYALYLRGDGPKPADPSACDAKIDDGHILLKSQLLPPQKLAAVSHLETIVVEPSTSGRGQRRPRTAEAGSYQNTQAIRRAPGKSKVVVEKAFVEELASPASSSSSSSKKPLKFEQAEAGFSSAAGGDVEEASAKTFSSGKKVKNMTSPGFGQKPGHQRKPSASDEARALYMRQLKGRRKMRASRDFDAEEEEQPELLKGEKGRKRLNVLESGYSRESMKPGPERVVGGN